MALSDSSLVVELATPEQLLFSAPAAMVIVPGAEGDFGVLPGHSPLISALRPGLLSIAEQGETISRSIFIAGGFAEVTPERCVILAEKAFEGEEMQKSHIDARIEQLTAALHKARDEKEVQSLEKELAVQMAMLDVVKAEKH